MGILSLLKRDEQAEIKAAWKRYAELLEADGDDAKSLAELKRVMQVLGVGTEDAEKHAQAIRNARRQQAIIADGSGLDKSRETARKAAIAHRAETERIVAERAKAQQDLEWAHESLDRRYSAAQRAVRELGSYKHAMPELLGMIEIPELV